MSLGNALFHLMPYKTTITMDPSYGDGINKADSTVIMLNAVDGTKLTTLHQSRYNGHPVNLWITSSVNVRQGCSSDAQHRAGVCVFVCVCLCVCVCVWGGGGGGGGGGG